MTTSIKHVYVERPELKTDDDRGKAYAAIAAMAPTSALVQASTSLQATVTALGKIYPLIKPASDLVVQDKQKLGVDDGALTGYRDSFDGELEAYFTLLEKDATDAAQLTAAGTTPRAPKVVSLSLTPDAPPSIDILIPKYAHGYFYASAHETGTTRYHYAAQWSPNPPSATSWVVLPGDYKRHKLTGASGTQVWVRYAIIRRGVQSDWSTAVLVTFP